MNGKYQEEITCGNIALDCYLNDKIMEYKQKNLHLETSIIIPEQMRIEENLILILDHLLDIAVDAVINAKTDQKFITLNMWYDRKLLHLKMKSPYFINEKSNLRMKKIKEALRPYEGEVHVENELHMENEEKEERTVISILLYMNDEKNF